MIEVHFPSVRLLKIMGFNEADRKGEMPKGIFPIRIYPGPMANNSRTVINIFDGALSVR